MKIESDENSPPDAQLLFIDDQRDCDWNVYEMSEFNDTFAIFKEKCQRIQDEGAEKYWK